MAYNFKLMSANAVDPPIPESDKMSLATVSQACRQTQDEYVTDWRVVSGIVGIVIVLIAALGLALVNATLHSSTQLETRISLNVPALIKSPVEPVTNTEKQTSPIVAPIVIVPPWLSSKSRSAVISMPEATVDAESTERLPPPSSENRIAGSTNLNVAKPEKALVPFGQVEDELRDDLDQHSVEISIDQVPETREELLPSQRRNGIASKTNENRTGEELLFALIEARPDLEGLPLRKGSDCRLSNQTIHFVAEMSGELRSTSRRFGSSNPSVSAAFDDSPERELEFEMSCVKHLRHSRWQRAEAVSTLVQMFQTTSHLVRLEIVNTLASVEGAEACAALVDLAIFDLSDSVRTAAVNALRSRQLGINERQRLIRGLRYPWTKVADNAADAVIALNRKELLPQLTTLAEEPDPSAPFLDADGEWRRTELVRVNHLRNCILCHAVSTSRNDSMRALVPTPGKPIPVAYYHSNDGDFVRADLTYIKQDFSLMKQVQNAEPWPAKQRFDYFLRTRRLTPREQEAVSQAATSNKVPVLSYPQRDAVLRAIRGLSSRKEFEVELSVTGDL